MSNENGIMVVRVHSAKIWRNIAVIATIAALVLFFVPELKYGPSARNLEKENAELVKRVAAAEQAQLALQAALTKEKAGIFSNAKSAIANAFKSRVEIEADKALQAALAEIPLSEQRKQLEETVVAYSVQNAELMAEVVSLKEERARLLSKADQDRTVFETMLRKFENVMPSITKSQTQSTL